MVAVKGTLGVVAAEVVVLVIVVVVFVSAGGSVLGARLLIEDSG